jgi:hypothetical protein
MFCLEPTTPIGVLWGGPQEPLSRKGAWSPNASQQSIWPNRFLEPRTPIGVLWGVPQSPSRGRAARVLWALENHDTATQTQTLLNEKLKNYNI